MRRYQPCAGALVIMIDALLVEVESGFAGVNRHRDGAHGPNGLLQVLSKQTNMT